MRSSKLFILILMLALSACSGEKRNHGVSGGTDATFTIDQITAGVVSPPRNDPSVNIPKSRTYNFKACIKDMAAAQNVIGQDFVVADGSQEILMTTDPNGCITWAETHEFDFYGDEQYFEIKRTISARGSHRGAQTITIAVTPWKDGFGSVVDTRYQQAPGPSKAVQVGFNQAFPLTPVHLRVKSFEATRQASGLSTSGLIYPTRAQIEFKLCLQTTVESKDVQLKQFDLHVEVLSGNERFEKTDLPVTSEQDGCIRWQDWLGFQSLPEREHAVPIQVTVRAVGDKARVPLATREGYINPWSGWGGSGGTFWMDGRDGRVKPYVLTDEDVKQCPTGIKVLRSTLQSDGMDYDKYEVDPYLNLTVAHAYAIQVEPFMQRRTLDRCWTDYLPPGKLKMTLVLARSKHAQPGAEKESDVEYVTSTETEVPVSAGVLTGNIVLKFPDVLNALGRNDFYIELAMVDANSAIKPATFVGQMPPMPKGVSIINMETKTVSASRLRAAGLEKVRQKNLKELVDPITLYRDVYELDAPDVKELEKYGLTADEVEMLVDHPAAADRVLEKLCAYAFRDSKPDLMNGTLPLPDCLAHPNRVFQIVPKDFIAKLNSVKPGKHGKIRAGMITVSSSTSEGVSNTTSHTVGTSFSKYVGADVSLVKIGLGGKYSFSPNSDDNSGWSLSSGISASAGVGMSWFDTTAESDSRGSGNNLGSQDSKPFSWEQVNFDIDAQYRRCVTLIPRRPPGFNPIHLCSAQTRSRKALESFYSLTQNFTSPKASIGDPDNQEDMAYTIFIRGEDRFLHFQAALEKSQWHMATRGEIVHLDDLLSVPFQFQRAQYFPGVLDKVVEDTTDLTRPDYPLPGMPKFQRHMDIMDSLIARYEQAKDKELIQNLRTEFKAQAENGWKLIHKYFRQSRIPVEEAVQGYYHNPIEEYYAAYLLTAALESGIYSWGDAWFDSCAPVSDALNAITQVENLGRLDVSKYWSEGDDHAFLGKWAENMPVIGVTVNGLGSEITRRKKIIGNASNVIAKLHGTPFYHTLQRYFRDVAAVPCGRPVKQTYWGRVKDTEPPVELNREPLFTDQEFESLTDIKP